MKYIRILKILIILYIFTFLKLMYINFFNSISKIYIYFTIVFNLHDLQNCYFRLNDFNYVINNVINHTLHVNSNTV